jgi:uncharacterized protein YbjT (DUF2867 family)
VSGSLSRSRNPFPVPDRSGSRTALLLGATGLVGGHCLQRLLDEPAYGRVRVLGRRPLDRAHPKLEQHTVDFDRLAEHSGLFEVDDVFCCLGTTIRKAGSQEAFRRVDLVYPHEAARLAVEEGAKQFLLVSALGADPSSRVFYNRLKGETEMAVQGLRFQRVVIVRPSLLLGERAELRPGERIAELVSKPLAPLMRGPLAKYRPIPARTVAAALVCLALESGRGVRVVESDRLAESAGCGAPTAD